MIGLYSKVKAPFKYANNPASVIVAFVLLALSSPVLAEENYLQNGTFDDDVSNWNFYGTADQALVWDSAIGEPAPGSLRLTAVNSSVIGPFAASECHEAPPGTFWSLDAFAREEPGSNSLSCAVALLIYMQPDCSDPTSAVVSGQQAAGNDWTLLDVEFQMPAGYEGIRAALSMSVDQSATGACNFDSVRLMGPPNFAEVPALGPYTLATLIAALALAGLFWLRRLH